MKQLLLRIRPHMVKMAILQDGDPVEISFSSEDFSQTMGSIYKGRVETVLMGMEAAFVNVGLKRSAFLHFCDVKGCEADFRFQDVSTKPSVPEPPLKVGDEALFQVIKVSGGEKGVRLSQNITIPGKRLVLLTTSEDIGVSRKITDEEERVRLRDMAQSICPKGVGVIMRTAACGCSAETLKKEVDFLYKRWQQIKQRSAMTSAPALLLDDSDLINCAVRDRFDDTYDELIIDDRESYEQLMETVRVWIPQMEDRVRLWDKERDLFCAFSVDERASKLLNRKVWLNNGAYLVIDPTEALTVIDVNSGKYVGKRCHEDTIMMVNKEAAYEIARQLRLRDIGGIVIVDFIDMKSEEQRQEIRNILAEKLKEDRTRTFIGEFTSLGLLEITRKKARHNAASIQERTCPYCHGAGVIKSEIAVMSQAVVEVENLMQHTDADILVRLHTNVAQILVEKHNEKPVFRIPEGRKVYVQALGCLHQATVQVSPVGPETDLNVKNLSVLT